MMTQKHRILMDKVDDTGSPSGYGTEAAPTTTTPTTPQATGDTSNSPAVNAAAAPAPDATPATGDKSQQAAAPEGDVTGYTTPAIQEDPKGDTTDTVVTDDKPLELDVTGIPEADAKDLHEFAKSQKLTKDQAQALAEKLKVMEQSKTTSQQAYEAEIKKVHTKWEAELKSDPDFGGQKFDQNIFNVNKLIREELPGLKNLLTTSGKRLPPSVMKDLNAVARKLYGETELVNGDKVSTKDTWHPTDFYKK